MTLLGRSIVAGLTAFRKEFFGSGEQHAEVFESLDARRMRYAVFWAMYANTAYESIHNWATAIKTQYASYKHIRSLYNPANRLGNFYATHIWGGILDADAGPQGAIPIACEDDNLRTALATLWKASRMATLKDVLSLRGTIEGDLVIRVHDDRRKERVYLERLDPGTVTELTLDTLGNVKGYIVEEPRKDPKSPLRTVTYKLVVTRDGDDVVYRTFLNNSPYGWDGQSSEWAEPYTFVPLCLIKHVDVGLEWGWSELHPLRSKVREVDDLASMVTDQIRKTIDPVWLMPGKKQAINLTGAVGTTGRPQPGREELKTIWNATGQKPEAMVAPLNIAQTLTHIENILKEMEREYPELQQDIWASGATSGRALRVARQRVESRVLQRRASYDAGIVRLQMMSVSIGGMRGYKGYEGFDLTSYLKGDLEHSVASRAVFTPDPEDENETDKGFWDAAKSAIDAGATLEGYLKRKGWSDDEIADLRVGLIVEEDEGEVDAG